MDFTSIDLTTAATFAVAVVATVIAVTLTFKSGTLGRKGINQVK